MVETLILLENVGRVKKFVSTVRRYDARMDLISGRCVLDAKSFMGICCMNLSKPITLRIYKEGKEAEEIVDALREYIETEGSA